MMGLANIVTMFLCIAFVFMLVLPSFNIQGSSGPVLIYSKINNVSAQLSTSMVVIPVNIPILGTPAFPNPFALFGGIATLLLSLGRLSTDVIGSVWLPPPLSLFIITTFTILTLIFAWSWWKGNNAA